VTIGQLESDEDAELRRLHMLTGFGSVANSVVSRYEALRSRDRRRDVREPNDLSSVNSRARDSWGTTAVVDLVTAEAQPSRSSAAAQRSSQRDPALDRVSAGVSPQQRVISDTREILAERPEPRRGLGFFRR
jgi:hypothetical protein